MRPRLPMTSKTSQRRSSRNIAAKLYQRSIEGPLTSRSGVLSGRLHDVRLPRLGVDLESILDVEKEIVHHVILGFTRDGHHLLSYSARHDLTNAFEGRRMEGCFLLHWWKFDQRRRLKNLACCRIFTGEFTGCDEPLLVVCEDADLNWIVAFGMFPSDSNMTDSIHECFATVAPNPVKSYPYLQPVAHPPFCVCLKYELCPPFPKIKPELSMRINDTVIVNTGAVVMALRIGRGGSDDASFASQFGNEGKQCVTQSSDCDSMSLGSGCIALQTMTESAPSDLIRLVFMCEDTLTRLSQLIGSVVPEPDCVLMFNVFDSQEREMKPVAADIWNHKCCTDGDVVVPVTQVIFNVDRYLSYALLINKDIAGRVKAVMDYDMEVKPYVHMCIYYVCILAAKIKE